MTSDSSEQCVGCGAAALARVRPYRTESPAGRTLFGSSRLERCGACHLVQMVPQPSADALSTYYAEAYREGGRHGSGVANLEDFPRDNFYFMYRGQSIASLVAPRLVQRIGHEQPRILDVGAGFGHLLHALGERFPASQRSAIEISQVCVDHLRGLGITVHQAATEEVLAGMREEFDLITLSHVFEHLREPARVLALLRERLAPGGLLYIEVPNIPTATFERWLDHPWAPRHDEPHLLFFDAAALRGTLERADLQVDFCDSAGPVYESVSWLHFHLPNPKATALRAVPAPLKRAIRRRRIGHGLSLFDHPEPFYEYGGERIWLRSISHR